MRLARSNGAYRWFGGDVMIRKASLRNTRIGGRLSALVIVFLVLPTLAQEAPPLSAGFENRMALTFSPDGKTAYWTEWDGDWGSEDTGPRNIYLSKLDRGNWSEPEPAPFTGEHLDDDPFVSPDGQWLYFVSERPVDGSGDSTDANIWRYSLTGNDRLEHLSVNSSAAEYSPVVTASGALYFAVALEGGPGQGDIYRAAPVGDGFGKPEALGAAINSPTGEWNLWVSEDEDELIFEASSRASNVSVAGDLYYSWRSAAVWSAAVPLESLNTRGSDLMPRFSHDGKTLYYTTARMGGHASIVAADWIELRDRVRAEFAPPLLVVNRSSHEVTFVDLAGGKVVDRIETGDGPHMLSNVSDGRVLATGYGIFPRPHAEPVDARPPFLQSQNSRITLIDIETREAVLDKTVDHCAHPHASWIVGERAFLTCEVEQRVAVLDLATGDTVASFDTRQEGSHVLGFAAGTNRLVVTNTDSGSATLIDIDSGDTTVVELAGGSEGQLVIDDRAWIGNAWDGSVSVVDTKSASVVGHIDDVCSFPIAFSRSASGELWLACLGSSELVAIDMAAMTINRRIPLNNQPLHVLLHPDRELAYISLPRKNAIAEIDIVTGREVRRIRVGIEPDGLRWAE